MQILLLGRVTVVDGERTTTLRSHRQAALLTTLALGTGHGVPGRRLVEAVFGHTPPATARNTLQVHASSLRRLLGHDAVQSHGDGYRLAAGLADVDAHTFSGLVDDGLAHHRAARHDEAARLLRAALALWRGTPFDGLDSPGLDPHRQRLVDLRLTALLARVDADLALGRHLVLVGELTEMLREHPYDEAVASRLMLALYRSGRQPEALAVHREVRDRLADELGVEPGPELRGTHAGVLRHDPALGAPEATAPPQDPDPSPGPAAGLVGRESLLAEVEDRVGQPGVTTLVGPSGVGKTRLARAVAARRQHRYPDGAVVVDVADVRTLEQLESRVRGVTAAQRPDAVMATATRPTVDRLRALVVLDDVPPLPGVEAWVDALASRGRVSWLLTSPRPLGSAAERVVQVPPLAAWTADDAPGPAAELLLRRARAAGADVGRGAADGRLAAQCAELLDGNPLALELAAPTAVLGLGELRTLLGGTSGGEVTTVAFDSSLDRLDGDELLLLDVLACAAGPLDLVTLAGLAGHGAAERAGLLARLARDGLVTSTRGASGATVFAVRPLLAAHRAAVRPPEATLAAQHRLLDLLVAAVGPRERWTPMQMAEPALARRLVALEPALAAAPALARDLGRPLDAVGIVMVASELHFSRYAAGPPAGRFTWMLDVPGLPPERRADLLLAEGVDLVNQDEPARGRARLEEALSLARSLDDPGRAAIALANLVVAETVTGLDFGVDAEDQREAVRLAEAFGSDEVLAGTLLLLYPTPRTPPELRDVLRRAVRVARSTGHAGLLALASNNLSAWLLENGDLEAARVHALEAVAVAERIQNRASLVTQRAVLQTVEVLSGSEAGLQQVARILEASWEHQELRTCADSLLRLAAGVRARGEEDEAGRCLGTYRALLVRAGAVPNEAEEAFVRQWLHGVEPSWPRRAVAEAVAALVAAWGR